MEPTTLFATQDHFVVEYVHNAIVTADWPASKNRPAPRHSLNHSDLYRRSYPGREIRPAP